MTATDNADRTRRWFDDVWNKRREATIGELLDPDAVGHLQGLVTRGIDGFLAARAHILGAFPDFSIVLDAVLAQGDDVVVRWSARGTHQGALMGVPPTAVGVSFSGITWLRFSEGRIVEGWDAWNQGQLMAELRSAAEGKAKAV